jgi:uncharacterized protein YqgC (DUF456 family)
MDIVLWVIAIAMIAVGIVGTVLPALPGVLFVFGGIVLAAWIEDFTRISGWTVGVAGVLAVAGIAVDLACQFLFAKRAGASKLGLLGAAIGTVAGIFAGLVGIVFFPLIGAAIGEWMSHRDAIRAGQVGVATWVGLLIGTVIKLALVFAMAGMFVFALLF